MKLPLRLLFYALLSFIAYSPIHLLAQTKSISPILDRTVPKDSLVDIETIPSPLELYPNWWHYFEGDNEKLATKTSAFLRFIDELTKTVSDDHNIDIKKYKSHIETSLISLLEISDASNTSSSEKKSFKSKYALDDLQNLERSLQTLNLLYRSEIASLNNNKDLIKALGNEVDSLFSAYRKRKTPSEKKLISGLEIMAKRLAWVVSKLKEPILTKHLKIQDDKRKILSEELNYASTHLTVTKDDISSISNNIDQQQIIVAKAKMNASDAHIHALEAPEDGLVGNFQLILSKQIQLFSEIQLAYEETQLKYLDSMLTVALLASDEPEISIDDIVSEYKKRESFRKALLIESDKWHAAYRNEIDSLISTLPNKENADKELIEVDKIFNERRDTSRETASALQKLDNSINDLEFMNGMARKILSKRQGPFFNIQSDSSYTFSEIWSKSKSIFNKSLLTIGDVPVTAFDILRAIIIILIAYLISRIVQRILKRMTVANDGKTSPVFYTLGRLSHYLIIIIGLIFALSSIGLNFTNLAIIAGALSVGIGFGLQSIVNNFVSGIIVLFEQNFKIGDFVELDSGMNGVVKDINVRSTVITTLDNLDIVVPNSDLVSAKVTNYTMNEPMFRIHIPFGVAYGSDKKIVEKAGLEAAKNVDVTYDDGAKRRPQVWLVGFGDSSLDFELIVWVVNKQGSHATPGSWRALYTWEIETALHKYEIEIPFPQRDLHLRSSFSDTSSLKV